MNDGVSAQMLARSIQGLQGLQNAACMTIRRGTAIGPIIPLLLLVPVLITAGVWMRDHAGISWLMFGTAVSIVAVFSGAFLWLMKNDPDRLQSEDFRCEMQRMHLIAAKELPAPVPMEMLIHPVATSNPAQPITNLTDIDFGETPSNEEKKL